MANFGPQIFFSWALPLLEVLHCYKLSLYVISRKTKLEKMAKNLVWSLILAPLAQFGPPEFFFWGGILVLLDNRHYCKLSLYAISWKTKEPNLRKGQKNVLGLILVHLVQIRAANFVLFCFFKNLAPPVTRYHAQLSSGTISEKI